MASETSEQRVKAAIPDAQAVETHRNPENGLLERVCIMNGYRKLFPEPSGSTANDAWDDALTHPEVVAFESTLRVQDAPEVVREDAEEAANSLLDPEVCPDCDGVGEVETMDRKTLPCPTCIYREMEAKKVVAKPLSPDSCERNGFICAEWRIVEEGPLLNYEKPYKRRQFVNRCDLPEGHLGKHLDRVLLVSWDTEDPPNSLRTRPEGEAKVSWRVFRKHEDGVMRVWSEYEDQGEATRSLQRLWESHCCDAELRSITETTVEFRYAKESL